MTASGGDVGIGLVAPVGEALRVLKLEAERLVVVAFKHRNEQRQCQERVSAHSVERGEVVGAQGLALLIVEREPGRSFRGVTVDDVVGLLAFPPADCLGRLGAIPLDELGVAVDGVEELVQQIAAHLAASGYQVKYASMVWKRSKVSL